MLITAGSHPALGQWKVGFNKDGRITALKIDMYLNAGFAEGSSPFVGFKAIMHMDNVYQKVFLILFNILLLYTVYKK